MIVEVINCSITNLNIDRSFNINKIKTSIGKDIWLNNLKIKDYLYFEEIWQHYVEKSILNSFVLKFNLVFSNFSPNNKDFSVIIYEGCKIKVLEKDRLLFSYDNMYKNRKILDIFKLKNILITENRQRKIRNLLI